MAKNQKFWKKYLTNSDDVKAENKHDIDALEEGLESLSDYEGSNRVVKTFKKTQSTVGEEIGNSVTHGVMAVFFLGMIPYAAIRAYIHAPSGKEVIDAVGISIYMVASFLMFLASTWYHSTKRGTTHKYVTGKLDHCMVFACIAGTYTPVWLSLIGGGVGIGFCIAQWCLCLAGILFKSLMYSKSKASKIISVVVYVLLGWIIVFYITGFFHAASLPCFWLVLSGTICYTVGMIFFAGKYKFAHMVWHFLVDFGAICHFIGLVYFLR
ncbi:MAG: hemolysin III family protein [Clostridiales bacterium]|nr:hemolysin III family protein [Clostridiales bacterium]